MQDHFPNQQGLSQLIQEITDCLERMDQNQGKWTEALIHLSPFFNLKQTILNFGENFQAPWQSWKNGLKIFLENLKQGQAAYQDLSEQMQHVLTGRSTQDPLFQEIARQGNLLTKDLQKRQDLARHLTELDQVMDRVVQQSKITPQQKQKIEDLVFRLQLLY